MATLTDNRADSREEGLSSSYEVYDLCLKEVVKVGIGAITVVWNGYQLTACSPGLSALPFAIALLASAYSLAEKAYPPLKGNRLIFAVSPTELYHIIHLTSGVCNAIAFAGFSGIGPLPLALLFWNTITSRPALHIGNSVCGSLLAYRKSI